MTMKMAVMTAAAEVKWESEERDVGSLLVHFF